MELRFCSSKRATLTAAAALDFQRTARLSSSRHRELASCLIHRASINVGERSRHKQSSKFSSSSRDGFAKSRSSAIPLRPVPQTNQAGPRPATSSSPSDSRQSSPSSDQPIRRLRHHQKPAPLYSGELQPMYIYNPLWKRKTVMYAPPQVKEFLQQQLSQPTPTGELSRGPTSTASNINITRPPPTAETVKQKTKWTNPSSPSEESSSGSQSRTRSFLPVFAKVLPMRDNFRWLVWLVLGTFVVLPVVAPETDRYFFGSLYPGVGTTRRKKKQNEDGDENAASTGKQQSTNSEDQKIDLVGMDLKEIGVEGR